MKKIINKTTISLFVAFSILILFHSDNPNRIFGWNEIYLPHMGVVFSTPPYWETRNIPGKYWLAPYSPEHNIVYSFEIRLAYNLPTDNKKMLKEKILDLSYRYQSESLELERTYLNGQDSYFLIGEHEICGKYFIPLEDVVVIIEISRFGCDETGQLNMLRAKILSTFKFFQPTSMINDLVYEQNQIDSKGCYSGNENTKVHINELWGYCLLLTDSFEIELNDVGFVTNFIGPYKYYRESPRRSSFRIASYLNNEMKDLDTVVNEYIDSYGEEDDIRIKTKIGGHTAIMVVSNGQNDLISSGVAFVLANGKRYRIHVGPDYSEYPIYYEDIRSIWDIIYETMRFFSGSINDKP